MKESRSSWWILAALTLGCVVLGALQFRWTAELSAAESARLRFDLGNRLDLFAAAINQEAARQERELLPAPEELEDSGWKRAHTERFRRWQDAVETPLFSRVMVARPEKDRLALYEVKEDGVEPVPAWPAEWSTFRATAERRMAGQGRPPSIDPRLWRLVEIPLFGPEGEEIEWLLLEVDADTVVNRWLPALATRHLKLIEYRYEVQDSAGNLVAGEQLMKHDASVPAFPLRFAGGGRRGRGPGPGRDHQEMRWTIRAAHQQGSLEAVVQSSRIRNLSIAGALIGMIAAAGFSLLRFNRQTREAAEVERRFFATVSHELRTPLTAIKSASQSLLDGTVKEERQQKQYAGIIARQAEQLTDLVEQVLYYAAAATKAPRNKAAVDTAAVLRSAIEGIAGEARAAGCRIEAGIPEMLPEILGDAASLRRLFQNLLHNAVRHGSEGKVIEVRVTAGRELEVQVVDRGKGLEDTEVNRIFEPFFRGERARSQQTRGAGIGLSVVRDIAQSHGGSVTAENRKDGVTGAVFTVRLPLMETTA